MFADGAILIVSGRSRDLPGQSTDQATPTRKLPARLGPFDLTSIWSASRAQRQDGGLDGGISDLYHVNSFLTKKRGVSVYETYTFSQGDQIERRPELLVQLREFFSSARRGFVIHFSGHGNQNGDWELTKGAVLTFEDIFQAFAERCSDTLPSEALRSAQKLLIVADCCYSGKWVRRLQELRQQQDAPQDATQVWVQAGCSAEQFSMEKDTGGLFTQLWVQDGQLHNSKAIDELPPEAVDQEQKITDDLEQSPDASIDSLTHILEIGKGLGITKCWWPMVRDAPLASPTSPPLKEGRQ